MMEDADGYNEIWTNMMLVWPEVASTQRRDLYVDGVTDIMGNFRDYIAPDDRVFQYASGLSSGYSDIIWASSFERASQLTKDAGEAASFRFAASQMVQSMARQNVTLVDAVVSLDQGSAWSVAFGLLCGARELADDTVGPPPRGCGPGWANESAPATPLPSHTSPSAVVHRRREPGAAALGNTDGKVPDKIVMAHSKEYGASNQSVHFFPLLSLFSFFAFCTTNRGETLVLFRLFVCFVCLFVSQRKV